MKHTSPSRLLVMLSVGGFAVWIAASQNPAIEPVRFEPGVGAAPYESAYPAPQVDRNAPPPETSPTF
jgi:hypothetical protein